LVDREKALFNLLEREMRRGRVCLCGLIERWRDGAGERHHALHPAAAVLST